jgi:iron complex transport system ATP-binding protein
LKQFDLAVAGAKLVLKDKVLALLSDEPLNTVSSAFHNGGGLKKTNAILNVEVLKSCSDLSLHGNPELYVMDSAKSFGLNDSFIGMVTAASVENFALASKRDGNLAVSAIATASDNEGNTCNYSESAGEPIVTQKISGTINIMVVIDGNPTESCLVSSLITVTEAKAAALGDLDIRSRYSGQLATGTITDAVVIGETSRGPPIVYGGPASKLGQLVGYCTRKAVKEAVMRAAECMSCRSVMARLKERHFSIEKMASELAKNSDLNADQATLATYLEKKLKSDPLAVSIIMAALRIDEDVEKGLIPPELGTVEETSKRFGQAFQSYRTDCSRQTEEAPQDLVDLPPFLKEVLTSMVRSALSTKTENLK